MKQKSSRLDTIKIIISSQEISSQEDLIRALSVEGHNVTQATLSRDLKQLKVAKAANAEGKYIYVLPNDIMYRRPSPSTATQSASKMLMSNGFISIHFSGNLAVIHTRPGYASSMAYDIDNYPSGGDILGTIAGDDTILMVIREGVSRQQVHKFLSEIIPNVQ